MWRGNLIKEGIVERGYKYWVTNIEFLLNYRSEEEANDQLKLLNALDVAKTQWYHFTAIIIAGIEDGFRVQMEDLWLLKMGLDSNREVILFAFLLVSRIFLEQTKSALIFDLKSKFQKCEIKLLLVFASSFFSQAAKWIVVWYIFLFSVFIFPIKTSSSLTHYMCFYFNLNKICTLCSM